MHGPEPSAIGHPPYGRGRIDDIGATSMGSPDCSIAIRDFNPVGAHQSGHDRRRAFKLLSNSGSNALQNPEIGTKRITA
uniref:Uncharacterized protein n=1 Tax=Rhodopseudomonas palustris (strain BisA53) TaxID=316055 RepID=Q07ID1_RHOP5